MVSSQVLDKRAKPAPQRSASQQTLISGDERFGHQRRNSPSLCRSPTDPTHDARIGGERDQAVSPSICCVPIPSVSGQSSLDLHVDLPPAWKAGSGSHENGRSFKVVAMEKKVQTSIVHEQGFGERECFANKAS